MTMSPKNQTAFPLQMRKESLPFKLLLACCALFWLSACNVTSATPAETTPLKAEIAEDATSVPASPTSAQRQKASPVPSATIVKASPTPEASPMPEATPIPQGSFLETFDGEPNAPQAWLPTNWDVAIHSRDRETWDALQSMEAAHGDDCSPPPDTHTISKYEDAVYSCKDHIMTAMRADGYGVIYLTPDHLVDFSEEEAIIRFDMSTARTSPRDWIDIWITPYEDNLTLPLESWLPDLAGEPRRAIHVRMNFSENSEESEADDGTGTMFFAELVNDFEIQKFDAQRWEGYEVVMEPSPKRRDTFELRLSSTHLKFGMPEYDFWWIDTELPEVAWTQGVVQLGHHSYNPLKECPDCAPNTWHWDNVLISPAQPFTMLRADRRIVNEDNSKSIHFPAAAPVNSHLRFAGIGNKLEISFNGGATWLPAEQRPHGFEGDVPEEHFRSFWTPVPEGITEVLIRGQDWWGGEWHVRDISIWSLVTEE